MLIDVSGEEIYGGQIAIHMVLIKGVVVGKAIRKLDVNGKIPGLHQFQIDQQKPGTAIPADEEMNIFKFNAD